MIINRTKMTPASVSTAIIAATFAGQVSAAPSQTHYQIDKTVFKSSLSPISHRIPGANYTIADEDRKIAFEEEIANIYQKLLKAQEPLGLEYSEVLSNSFWELLEE